MTDYIDRAAAITSPLWAEDLCPAAVLNRLPAADVAPVVHGRWTTPRAIIECSKCGFGMFPDGYFFEFGECVHANESQYRPNFCPNSGAKMDLEESR